MAENTWTVRLSAAAANDFCQILRWTEDHFGSVQARIYADTLSSALKALSAGPSVIGVKERPEIGSHIRTLHVARNGRNGRNGRHFVLFRVAGARDGHVIDVLRLLHDSMDLVRHSP